MVAIFGGFNVEFSGRAILPLPRKERTPTSGGKLVGVQVCGPEDMPPDLASASAKWKVPQNRLPKMPQDPFSVGGRYQSLYPESTSSGIIEALRPP